MGTTYINWLDRAEATDRYTVVFHCNRYSSAWYFTLLCYELDLIYPPELVEAGMHDWKNQVGSGAFKLTEYVKDVKATYERNPDWWNRMQTINGKEYELPFIDKVTYPIVTEESTRIAALRTGRVDINLRVPILYRDTLAQTSPELLRNDYYNTSTFVVMFQWRQGTWLDKEMRHALKIGTNVQAIIDSVLIEGAVQGYPLSPSIPASYYTPLEDLPPEIQKLWTYNPDLARQMIIDAGYPEGLDMEVVIDNTTASIDRGAMLKEMWSKIGINLTLKVVDTVAIRSLRGSGDFKDAIIVSTGNASPEGHLEFWTGAPFSAEGNIDQYLIDEVQRVMQIRDPVERAAEVKRLTVYRMDTAWLLGLGTAKKMVMYWPWIKNYYGELQGYSAGLMPELAYMWIDQELKTEMGY